MSRDHAAMPIGAVTQLTGISSHTLRKWESRYGAIEPERSDSGRRLYTREHVQRLTLLRDLTRRGHQISRLSGMSNQQLEALTDDAVPQTSEESVVRAIVVGPVLSARLSAATSSRPLELISEAAATWLETASTPADEDVALVVELPTVSERSIDRLAALRRGGFARVVAVYGFAAQATLRRLLNAGVLCLKGPTTADELLRNLELPEASVTVLEALEQGAIPAHRFSEESIARLAALSPKLQCECPNHIAQLVLDISAFEQYSLECEDSDPAERLLHARLRLVAANARALFEEAVAIVAENEGLPLEEI